MNLAGNAIALGVKLLGKLVGLLFELANLGIVSAIDGQRLREFRAAVHQARCQSLNQDVVLHLRQDVHIPLPDLLQIRFLLKPFTHGLRQLLIQFADPQRHWISTSRACGAGRSIASHDPWEFQKRIGGFFHRRLKFGQSRR